MIGDEDRGAGPAQRRLTDTDLLRVEVQHIAVVVECRTAENREIEFELLDDPVRHASDKSPVTAAKNAARDDDLATLIGNKSVCDVQIVGHDK